MNVASIAGALPRTPPRAERAFGISGVAPWPPQGASFLTSFLRNGVKGTPVPLRVQGSALSLLR
jgi:hypothetical protein